MVNTIPPLVELAPAPTVSCSGMAPPEIIHGQLHCVFYQYQREGAEIVRSIALRLILPASGAVIRGAQIVADAFTAMD